jgi:hypothetical protein
VEIAATGFCNPGGILQLFHCQNQEILRLPTAAEAGSSSSISRSASSHHVYIGEILHQLQDRRRIVVPHQAIITISRLISVKAEVDEFDRNSTSLIRVQLVSETSLGGKSCCARQDSSRGDKKAAAKLFIQSEAIRQQKLHHVKTFTWHVKKERPTAAEYFGVKTSKTK